MLVGEHIFKKPNPVCYSVRQEHFTELRSLAQHHIFLLMRAKTITEPQKLTGEKKKKSCPVNPEAINK